MRNFMKFNLNEIEPERIPYYKKLSIKNISLPASVHSSLITKGNVITIGDLLEVSSLDLFNILDQNYVLYKETKDALSSYGISLFASSSAQAKKIKNRYHHSPLDFEEHNNIKKRQSNELDIETIL